MDLYRQAIKSIHDLVEEAQKSDHPEPMVMALATVDQAGQPTVRIVYVHAVIDSGLVFFTNRNSRKAHQLEANPRAAACLYWQLPARQIQVEGFARPVDDEHADLYWAKRGRDSQLVAWASHQDDLVETQEQFNERLAEGRQRFDFQRQVPRPRHWSGYCLEPERIEFWKASWRYPQQRVCYQKTPDGWTLTQLTPP